MEKKNQKIFTEIKEQVPGCKSLLTKISLVFRVAQIRIRKFLIKLLSGKMGVVLNVDLIDNVDGKGNAGIAYACRHGGMCEISGVK